MQPLVERIIDAAALIVAAVRAFERAVAGHLRNQYSIGYEPANKARDGKFRKIKVELVNPSTNEPLRVTDEKGKPIKYQIVAKNGYTAPREVE